MSRLGPTGLTQLLTDIKTWVTTKLGNYVTTNTTQTITGKKLFTNDAIQLDSIVSMSGSTMFIDTSAAAPRGEFPAEVHRVGRIYIGDNTSYNGAWFIVDPTIDTNKAYYRMVTTNPDNTDSTRFSITWDGSKTGARCRKNVSMGDLLPSGNNTYNLGADDLKWDIGYIHNLIGTNKENASEDANNYYSTTSGSHMTFYTTTNGGTKLSNVPAAVNTHLESRTIRYLSSSDWIVEQICHNSFGLYYRKGTNGTWEDWKTFAFTDSNITGTAANVTGTVAIANGGTGATTRLNAVKNLTNESVGTPTHFLAITTNYAKAGYTTVAQAKTVLGITGDMGSHSDSEYVHKTGDESISGAKTFSSNITINGTYLGTESSTNERTNIYLLANRDTADASGAYISRFRQNRTQGAMGSSDVSYISFDFLENSTRYTRCFTMGLIDWDSDGVPQTYYLTSPNGKGSLGTATTAWNKVYANSYYLGTTAFTDKFVTTDTAQTITGVKTLNSDTLVANQGNGYRMVGNTDGGASGYGVFQRVDGSSWYLMVTAQNDALGSWTSARPAIMNLSTGVLSINGNAATATQFSANTTVALTGDATGTSAGSKKGWSVPVTLANSGVTAGSYGPSTAASPAHGGTFSVPYVTVDAKGRVTAASTVTITLPADSNTDTLMTQNVSTTNNTYPILLCPTANATSNQGAKTGIFGSGVKVNPKTSIVSAKGFSGIPTGNTYVNAVKDGGALVNSQATAWGAIWRAPTKDYQVAGATWSSTNNNVYICYSVTNANAEAGTNTMAKSLIWAADTGTLTTTTFSGALSGNASTATEFSANKDVTLTGDVTGTASSKAGWSVATTLANSGVTAGTYGPSEDVTGNNNTTISVPQITVDAKGRVTSVTNRTYTSVNTDTNTDTKVTQTVTNDNACYPLLIANTASASHTGLEPTTETDEVRKAYNINVQARYGFIYARNSYNHDNLKGSVAGGNRTSAGFYGSTYDGATVGGVELGRVDKYGNRYSRLYATNYITDGALAPDGTAVAATFDVGVLADGTKYLNTSAGWYCNVYPTLDNTRTLGTSSLRWKECYCNAYYLGTTAFGDIVTHNASEFLTSHQSLSSCVKNNVTNNQTIKSTAITRGTAPSSAQTFGIAFSDNNNKYIGNIYGQYATDKSTYVGLYAYKGTTTSNGDNAYVRVGYDASGNVYTSAPTPATTDNSTQIATTAFVKAQGYLTSHPSITLSTNTTSTASPAHGGTFTCIDSVTQDTNGHITKVNTKTITLPSDNNTDTKVTQTVTTGNSTYPVLLCATANATATGTTTSRFSAGLTVNARYSSISMTNKYDTANTKGVRNSTKSYLNGAIIFRCYDASEMGRIHCESSKNGYQQTYMMASNYIKNGAISPEGTATTCYITVRVRDNGSRTIYTDGSWENSLIPYANNTHSLGTESLQWKNAYAVNIYENGTALSSKYVQINSLAGGKVAGSLTHSIGSLVLARCSHTAFASVKLYANVAGLQLYPCRTEIYTAFNAPGTQLVPIVVRSDNDSNLGSGTWRYLGGTSTDFNTQPLGGGEVYGMFLRVA